MNWRKIKQLKKIKLEKSEKNNVRQFLSVRMGVESRHISYNIFNLNLLKHKNMFAGIMAVIILLTSGGTTFAAENSVPGDILYPIKIEVNEKVLTALQLNEEKKAEWAARQAERRLEEAEKLAENGKLNSDNSEHLANQLKKHLDKTASLVKKMEDKGNIQSASQVSAHLKYLLLAHSDVIVVTSTPSNTTTSSTPAVTSTSTPNTTVTTSSTTSTSTIDIDDDEDEDGDNKGWRRLKKEIKMQLASSTAWETKLKDKFTTSTTDNTFKAMAAEGLKKAAENKLAEVSKYFEHKKDRLSAENIAAVQTKLTQAGTLKTQADQKLQEKKYVEAFALYHESMKVAQNAKSTIERAKEKKEDESASSTRRWFEEDKEKKSATSTKKISDDEDGDEDEERNNRGRDKEKSRRD